MDRRTFISTNMLWFSAQGGVPLFHVDVQSVWVGAPTSDGATVVARTTADTNNVVLVVTDPDEVQTRTSPVATTSRAATLTITGLDPGTEYTYAVETGGQPSGPTGRFRTLPAPGPLDFLVTFSGDAQVGSNHVVFDAVREASDSAALFIHLGDIHYGDIGTNSQALFDAAYDTVLAQSRQAQLFREVPTVYMWDDHDYGPSNSGAASTSRDASTRTYRRRVPHYPLPESAADGAIYHSFVIGRVRFVVTDQRSRASANNATDNSSKSMLGATQKAWFKSELDAAVAANQMVVWVCSRVFGAAAPSSFDHWGAFSTERTELADYIKAHAPGRVVVLSADRHSLDIDDGSNHDFATGGGCPLPCFQAAPLDQTVNTSYGNGTYSEGTFGNVGQFGTMQIEDSGGASIGVTWRGFNSAGTELVSHSFSVAV